MHWNKHPEIAGQHAFLGASKYHWLGYDEKKLIDVYRSSLAAMEGTAAHDFAATCIRRGQRLPKTSKTLNMYVNDAIGFRMEPEVPLYYSRNCFGTTDAIVFHNKLLRIHDFKSGVTPAHMEQLDIYAALFCLEYQIDPSDIDIVERIYQSNKIIENVPSAMDIREVSNKIIAFDKVIEKLRMEEQFQ